MIGIEDNFRRRQKAWFVAVCGILGLYTVLETYALISLTREENRNLLRRTFVKADKNQDKILQKQEITDLLSQLGMDYVISNDISIPRRVEEKGRVDYNGSNPQIVLGKKDLEKYLQQ